MKRDKLGRFIKGITPPKPFKKGNVPWNKKPEIELICLNCGIKKMILYGYRKKNKKFCSVKCSSNYAVRYGHLKNIRFKQKDEKYCVYKGKEKEYKKEWYLKNKERLLLLRKERYEKNRERYNETNKKWQERNKEKVSFIKQQYKRRKRMAVGFFSFEEWELLKKKFDNRCANCKELKKLEADHIKPLSKGGTNFIMNIQPLCRSCNSSKGNKVKI